MESLASLNTSEYPVKGNSLEAKTILNLASVGIVGSQDQKVATPSNLSAILIIFALLSIATYFASKIVNRFKHLSEYPGPWIAAYTRLWICRVIGSGNSAQLFVEVNKKYGPIARIGPNHLMTSDPVLVRRILAARSHYTRGPWFDSIRIDPKTTNIVSERDTGKHNHLRHQMSGGYGGKEIENLERDISERVAEFVQWLDTKAAQRDAEQKPVDLARPIQYLTVDIITHLCFGKPLGFVRESRDLFQFLQTIETQLPIVQHFSVILELNALLRKLVAIPFLVPFITPSARDKSGIGVIMRICREVIDERYAPGAESKRDMLGAFKNHGLTADDAETEMSISLVAGSDTTATSMRAILLMIISNARVYKKLQAEIDECGRKGQLSSPVADAEARQMPYLQACIKEGLRRYPPITQLRERMSPSEGDMYEGRPIPPGTFVGINAWGLQLDPVFGSDAEVFRPERWIEADADKFKEMNQVQELVFGYGNTRCLGIPIALMNLNKTLVELFRRYDIALADPTRPWKSLCYGIFFQKDFRVLVTHREHKV